MKHIITYFICAIIGLTQMNAQDKSNELFQRLDLNRAELSEVKKLHSEGKNSEALEALLQYFRAKTTTHPDIDLENIKITKQEQKWADEGLEHKFFAHQSHQPSYFYGDDINWQYWPVKDNELRWQLHRTKWWIPMGKSYLLTGDEKYAKEWVFQYVDWIKKNPLALDKFHNNDPSGDVEKMDNVLFAWRPLEVSHRLQDQTILFPLFINSPSFTPEFLEEYLLNFFKHAEHLYNNYSKEGNHLLFEAQRLLYAGSSFPEFKEAEKWRKSGIEVLKRELKKQVYADGVQYELDPSYHLASINVFAKAARMAQVKGFAEEFPQWYFDTIEQMVEVVMDMIFPDYTYPLFSDSRLTNTRIMVSNFKDFAKLFPKNKAIRYFASQGKKGTPPAHLSKGFLDGGFFVFRNGWDKATTQMVLKAGPEAEWHNQPDNGTFELWMNNRNYFIDSGSFMYGGDEEVLRQRAWFKQTRVHNTLTLNNANIEETNSKTLLWDVSPELDVLVTENQSYKELKHRRSVFFVDQKFFIILDEAMGAAHGDVGIHYHFSPVEVEVNEKNFTVKTQYPDQKNIKVQVFAEKGTQMKEEEGWTSYAIREKIERPAFVFEKNKKNDKTLRFITIIVNDVEGSQVNRIKANVSKVSKNNNKVNIKVSLDNKTYNLGYDLN